MEDIILNLNAPTHLVKTVGSFLGKFCLRKTGNTISDILGGVFSIFRFASSLIIISSLESGSVNVEYS